MPTYTYRREDGSTFEVEQRITEDPLKTCPTTGQPVKRIITAGAGLVFKGSGFYLTDYARGAAKATPESGTADSGGADSGGKGDEGREKTKKNASDASGDSGKSSDSSSSDSSKASASGSAKGSSPASSSD